MEKLTYRELFDKQQQELSDFPIAYAFNKQQLEEALVKLGAKDVSECVTYLDMGDVMKKTDVPAFKEMLKRHRKEMLEAIGDPEFAYEAFLYEMDNHEYAINWSGDEDVLGCFYLNPKMLKEMKLEDAYNRARAAHFKHAREWDMI